MSVSRASRQPAKGHSAASLSKKEEGQPVATMQRDPLSEIGARLGESSAVTQAATLNRATGSRVSRAPDSLLSLQRSHGNRHVQRVLALSRQSSPESEVTPEVKNSIQSKLGTGQHLDRSARSNLEPAFGIDFSGVRIHTDKKADSLSRALNARAFTTGSDIFFRQGEYEPGSSSGRELLAHELTHVVQHSGIGASPRPGVSNPSDTSERQASQTAKSVVNPSRSSSTGTPVTDWLTGPSPTQSTAIGRDLAIQRYADSLGIQREADTPMRGLDVSSSSGEMISRINWGCALEWGAFTAAVIGAVATCGAAILTLIAPEPVLTKLGAVLLGAGCGVAIASILLALAAVIKCKEQQDADAEELRRLRDMERRLQELEEEIRRRTESEAS